MQRVKDFWADSYHSDKIAFGFELTSFITTVAGSLTLALQADNPDMLVVYPMFFVGSVTGAYAYLRRGIAWPLMLTTYFAIINVFGFGVAAHWW